MSMFGDDLIQSLNEALAHARGEGPATVHAPVAPPEVRKQAKLTQAQMAPPMAWAFPATATGTGERGASAARRLQRIQGSITSIGASPAMRMN